MKTLLCLLFPFISVCSGFAQGTINFVNDSSTLSSPPDRLIRFGASISPFGTNNAPGVGTNWKVQLYYGFSTTAESALIPLTAAPANLRVSTTSAPGVWANGGLRTFTGPGPGLVLRLQIRVWDINFGATFEQAEAFGSITGTSRTFLYTVPQPSDPSSALLMANFQGMLIDIPEPSALSLAGVGLATFWLTLRRRHRSIWSQTR